MKKHIPTYLTMIDPITKTDKISVYYKTELNDHFLFLKDLSITINCSNLCNKIFKPEGVVVYLKERKVSLFAYKKRIIDYCNLQAYDTDNYSGKEKKYHYPIEKWHIISGDLNWMDKLKKDIKENKLKK